MAATIIRNSMENITGLNPRDDFTRRVSNRAWPSFNEFWLVMRAFENLFKIALIGLYAFVAWKGLELARFALLKERVEALTSMSSRPAKGQIPSEANELVSILKS